MCVKINNAVNYIYKVLNNENKLGEYKHICRYKLREHGHICRSKLG